MTALIVICATFLLTILIAGTLSTIEKCSFYKWNATNPDAFECDELDGGEG